MLFESISVRLARLAALVAVSAEWAGAIVGLYKDGFTPGSNQTYAAFDAAECDFTGYARSAALVWGTPFADSAKNAIVAAASVQFQATGAGTPNSVKGYAVLNAAGTGILWAEDFDAPRLMDENADAIIVLPKYKYAQQSDV